MECWHWILAFMCFVVTVTQNDIVIEAKTAKIKPNHVSISQRIMGGHDAGDGQAPFACSLQFRSRHFCGCAIISPEWVITAGHCLKYGINTEDIKIFVGSSKLSSVGMRYTAKDTIVHEQYDEPLNANDIGLIRVRDSIKFNDKVQPIKYTRKQVPANTDLQTFGWGRLSENGIRPDNLQVLTVHSISNEECNDEKFDLSIAAHESHLCTLDAANEGICAGDSGGPLIWYDELVGIVNWAVPNDRDQIPQGYAKISYFYDWIEKKIKSQ